MTEIERQEETARIHLRPGKAILAGLLVGLIFFFVSRGIPWFSAEIPDAAMGRPLYFGAPEEPAFVRVLVVHFLLAMGYALVIAAAIYRLKPLAAVLAGGLAGLALYAVNYILFRYAFGYPEVTEVPIAVTHVAFALGTAGMYKAISVRHNTRVPASAPSPSE